MPHPLQCRCGNIRGHVDRPELAIRAVCYCGSCQAYAHYLGHPADILDSQGGPDVMQVLPKNVTFTQGADTLACLRLTERGLLRCYADSCKTPIGNTLDNSKISFVRLLHSCLDTTGVSVDGSFGGVRARVNTEGARGLPFFYPDTGKPRVSPHVLTTEELARVMARVQEAKC